MTIFTVHQRQDAGFDPLLIAHRFCWAACALGPVWLLWRRLWLAAVALTIFDLGTMLAVVTGRLSAGPAVLMLAVAAILLGLEGPEMRRRAAERRHRPFIGVAGGVDEIEALTRIGGETSRIAELGS